MKRIPVYRLLVPGWNKAFKVCEDCCYEVVVYQGDKIGVTMRFDRNNELNGILLCDTCYPSLEIKAISEAQYLAIREDVNLRRAS
jgi:hypothetical protein